MEGKTTVVSNLGFALAETGSQVLLIDGDMRRPQLHRIFDQANSWGLSDVLREWNSIEELPLKVLVKKTAVPNLYLLPGGAVHGQHFGLLHSGRMSKLLARFREEFDYVLVDAPPCLEFADARNMARYADGLVLVVRARYTERKTAQAAVQRLECDGIRVTGVILNGWDPSRSDRMAIRPSRARPAGNSRESEERIGKRPMTSLVGCDSIPRPSGILSVLVVGYVALLPYQFEVGNGINFAPADCLMLLVLLLAAGQLKYRKPAWTYGTLASPRCSPPARSWQRCASERSTGMSSSTRMPACCCLF